MPNEIYHRSEWGNPKAEGFGDVYFDASATNKLYKHSDNYENSDGTDKILRDIPNKASIVLTPTAYSDGSLNTVIPPYQVLPQELVTNGTFDTDSDWNKGTGWSISGGKASSDGSANFSDLTQNNTNIVINKNYKITYTVSNYVSGSFKFIMNNNTASGMEINANGTYTDYISALSQAYSFRTQGSGFIGSIDNVSVKEIQEADFDFSRGSSATRVNEKGLIEDVQILSGNLVQNGDFEQIGSENIINGDFSDGENNWTFQTGWSVVDGKATVENQTGWLVTNGTPIPANKQIRLQFDLVLTSGTLRVKNNTNDFSELFSTVGSYTVTRYYSTGGSTTNLQFPNYGSGFSGSIDNVSVKEVGQNWIFSGDTTVVDNGAKFDNTSVYSEIRQNNIMTPNSKIRLTITIEDYVGGGIAFPQFGVADGNGDPNFNISSNGTYVFESIFYSTDLTVKRTNNGTDLVVSNISVIEITDDTDIPRIDYTSGQGALLLEPQSTNLITYSEDFDNSYWEHNADITVTSSSELAPNGKLNANLIEYDGSGYSFIRASQSVPSSAATISVFAKKGNWRYLGFRNFQVSGNDHTVFDFDTQTFSNIASGQAASFEIFPNGWYKIKVTQPSPEANPYSGFTISNSTGAENNPTDGQVANVHLFGAQLEQKSFATSYIPTEGSTVTRSADVANNSGNADLFNDSEGVLMVEASALAKDGTNRYISISDSSDANRLYLRYRASNNVFSGSVVVNNSLQVLFDTTDDNILNFSKFLLKYKENDFEFWLNGFKLLVDTNGSTFPNGTLNQLRFDTGGTGVPFYGNVKTVAVFKEALTDAELESLTSWISFAEMATDLEYTLE